VEYDDRSGPPRSHTTDENVEKVRNLVHSDRRFSIGAMAVQLNLDKETARQIVSDDLSTKKVSAMMVLRLLNDELKQHRIDSCCSLSSQLTNNFLPEIIIGDET
jgi:hypothetical protein